QAGVAVGAQADVGVLVDVAGQVDVAGALFGHGGGGGGVAAGGRVVVAEVEAGIGGQVEQAAQGAVEGGGGAAGEVGAGGGGVGGEQGVADEGGIADHVGDAVLGVAGGGDHAGVERADAELVAVGEQVVELAAVDREVRFEVEDLLEARLHAGDAAADGHLGAGLLAQPGGGGHVVGVGVGLEDPLGRQAVRVGGVEQPARRVVRDAGAGRLEVHHRVDDRGVAAVVVVDQMREGAGGGIVEA